MESLFDSVSERRERINLALDTHSVMRQSQGHTVECTVHVVV